MGRFHRILLLTFCMAHAAMMVLCLIPRSWPPRSWLQEPVLTPYQAATGSIQEWNMFWTIPPVHRLEARLSRDGSPLQEVGPVLPGLRPHVSPGNSRLFLIIDRTLLQPHPGYLDAWLERIREEAAARGIVADELTVTRSYTRNLHHIRQDGIFSKDTVIHHDLPAAVSP